MATITKESIGPLHEKINVKLHREDYLPAFEKSLKEYSKKANIPGFRPGKVPAGMIKKMYGPSLFMDEVLRCVDKELLSHIENEKTDIFAQPLPMETDMANLDVNNPADYSFDFEIGLKPDVQVPDLATSPITAYNIDITNDMLDNEIERLQNRYGNATDKEVVDDENNILNVVFHETDDNGKEVEGGLSKSNSLLLKYFTEAKRNELMGKKAGDSIQIKLGEAFEDKELEFIAPDLELDAKDEVTKQKNFSIEITKVGELEKRNLDKDFFEQLYPGAGVETEEEFRQRIHDEIFNYWASQSRNQIHDQIFHNLVDHTKIDFPESFLKKWLLFQNSQLKEGQPKKTGEDIDKEMPAFLNQLKWSLISDKIIKDQNIQVEPDEIRDFAKAQLFSYMGGNVQNMDEQPWVNDYVEKMMKDRKFIEDAFARLQSQKVFDWAETQIRPTSQSISADDFNKMVSMHSHNHHH